MVGELVNVLAEAVEVRGGLAHDPARWLRRSVRHEEGRWFGMYRLVLVEAISALDGPVARIELHRHGEETRVRDFLARNEFLDEVERLEAALFTRQWVEWVAGTLTDAGIVPECFRQAILAGDLDTLVIAADWQDERDNPNAAMLLRAAYHRIRGEANVAVGAGKGKTIVLNPHPVTKRSPAAPGVGVCRAVVVEAGKSVRIVSVVRRSGSRPDASNPGGRVLSTVTCVEERVFRVGDQAEYGSYNLVYFAPVKSITAKTVVIVGGMAHQPETHRLSLAAFVEKNHDFDLAKAQKRNNQWMD